MARGCAISQSCEANNDTHCKTSRHIKEPDALKVVGAHDAFSAHLIKRAGLDGDRASGFAILASLKCIPDASFITSSQQLDVERNIVETVSLPVIANCDTGYGNTLNVMRTVNDRARAGAAAICIEDNVYPKRCSLCAGIQRELIPIEEHCGKIRAAQSAQSSPEFMIIVSRQYQFSRGWIEVDPFDKVSKDLGQDPAGIPFINIVSSHQLLLYKLAHLSLRMTKLH